MTRPSVWQRLQRGESGVGYTTIFDASKFPTKISAEVKNWDITKEGEDAEAWKFRGRHTKFACGAAKQAMAESGVLDSIKDPTRFGVYLGCGEGSQDFANFSRMMAAALTPDGLDQIKFTQAGPNQRMSDSSCMLETEASMHGSTLFPRSA